MASGLQNPEAPLTTVEVLISTHEPIGFDVGGVTQQAERATLAAVRTGFDRWLDEVQRNPKNVGVIYFCGHGIMGNGPEQFLLLEDYGNQQNRPFATGCFDMTTTLRALWRTVPAQLYVFVDACRTFNRNIGDRMANGPGPLLEEPGSTRTINSGNIVVESTVEGQPAYGDTDDVSRFTAALLLALEGYCGEPQSGSSEWVVNRGALSQSLPKLLALVNGEHQGAAQTCALRPAGLDAPLHVRAGPPQVNVIVQDPPRDFVLQGQYTLNALHKKNAMPITGGLKAGIWQTDAPKGTYAVEVLSRANSFKDFRSDLEYVETPVYPLPLTWEARA